ncbi:MAG: hypothetical protein NZ651_07080 [Candidatus Bipolaricaulota bacterium]|nr:hypothetical protein [Candidatus Bipolaricaulota bacterium]MDW8127516.1 hypothetical protein [Candidatus Bipolaricaulota bacterium]
MDSTEQERLKAADAKLGEAYAELDRVGERIAKVLAQATGQDVGWTLGWAEAGPETICFWGEEEGPGPEGSVGLWELLWPCKDCLKLSHVSFDAPFGLYLTPAQAQRVRDELRAIFGCRRPCPSSNKEG